MLNVNHSKPTMSKHGLERNVVYALSVWTAMCYALQHLL